MKTSHPLLSRRSLLKGGAALGLSALTPAMLLSACGGGDTDTQALGLAGKRETRDLHFDLSHGQIANPELRLTNSSTHRKTLIEHTAESRARHRQSDPILGSVSDEKLTHYLEGVDVPAEAIQLGSVWGTHPTTGKPMLALNFLHVPSSSMDALAKRRVARGQIARGLTAKLRSYGVTQAALDSAPTQSQIGPLSGPFDVATALIFQHPAITNLDPNLGADIVDRVQNLPCDPNDDTCTPYSGDVAFQIALMIGASNYPSTTSSASWATLATIPDPTTQLPAVDEKGNTLYRFEMNPALADPVGAAVKAILNNINDDPLFMGTNWQSKDGGIGQQPQPTQVAVAARQALAASDFALVASVPFGARRSGVRLHDIAFDNDRNVVFTVVNEYIRSNGVYVQYYDGAGTSIPNTTATAYDDGDAYYNSIISPQIQVMGIPLQGSTAISTNFRFTMPPDAAKAVVYYGGLGLGGMDAFSKKALIGTVLTLVLNIGLPMICLTAGISITLQNGLRAAATQLLTDPIVIQNILKLLVVAISGGTIAAGIQSSATNLSIKPFLISAGTFLLQLFLSSAPRMGALLASFALISAPLEAAPFVGLALWVLSTAADLATIGETLIECLTCPAIDQTTVSLMMQSSVQISRDCNDFQFPATARTWTVKAFYDGGTTPIVVNGTIQPGQVDPISVPLTTTSSTGAVLGVPSGGNVQVQVYFYSEQGCLVGQGTTGSIGNIPDKTTGSLVIPVSITEMKVPLDATSSYKHYSKLTYSGGAHQWSPTAPQPTLTHANLCQGNDGAVCALHGLTVHTASGMAGYGYNAGGQGVSLCTGGGSATSMNVVQNIFLGSNPDSGLKLSTCGDATPIGIAYSPTGVVTGGLNFLLQQDSDGVYQLRSTDLTAGNFDLAQTLSWGRFSSPLDSLTTMGTSHVVGVNRATHTMEILRLPAAPSSTADELVSVPFPALAGGKGSRAGLLNTPVAVCSVNGTLLVLEQGNTRVQAFDADGNNVNTFKDASNNDTPLMPLMAESGVTYLDIAVEGAGYIYVLSYIDSGRTPENYRLDVYTPTGQFLFRTSSVAAANIAVDLYRNVYSLNYETVDDAPRTEPSLSQWQPVSTTPCGPASSSAGVRLAAAGCPAS